MNGSSIEFPVSATIWAYPKSFLKNRRKRIFGYERLLTRYLRRATNRLHGHWKYRIAMRLVSEDLEFLKQIKNQLRTGRPMKISPKSFLSDDQQSVRKSHDYLQRVSEELIGTRNRRQSSYIKPRDVPKQFIFSNFPQNSSAVQTAFGRKPRDKVKSFW